MTIKNIKCQDKFLKMDNYCLMKGIERLKQLKPDFEFKNEYFVITKSTDEIENKEFYKNTYKEYQLENFNPSNIVGTKHPSYSNIMWIEMLGSLKRFKIANTKTKESISELINNTDDVCLAKYGHEFYIVSGNHRLCIAKLIGETINTVNVIEYEFDNEYYNQWHWFKKRKINPISISDDCWVVEIDTVQINIKINMLNEFMNYYDNFQYDKKWYDFLKPEQSDFFSIRNVNDINNRLFIEIIKKNKKRHTTHG